MRKLGSLLVTGGCGFIGSNFVRYLFDEVQFDGRVVNLDALTYAGNPLSLVDVERRHGEAGSRRYKFVRADVADGETVSDLLERYEIDTIVHLAAESHVDRSIQNADAFVRTNVFGTYALLAAARTAWKGRNDTLFHHVSTDEVYGALGETGSFSESTPYDPRSPYSASKAASDHFVRAFNATYGLPATISNCSNNYGPYQFPEKLIPLMILNLFERKPLPVYGEGRNVRDWIHVADHCAAIWRVVEGGVAGESYNVGGRTEWRNIDIVRLLCREVAAHEGSDSAELEKLITFVPDRPGHDFRYAIDSSRIERELSWKPSRSFEEGVRSTIAWYAANGAWVKSVRTGEYLRWIEENYGKREAQSV